MSNVSQFIGSGWIPLETIELTGAVTTVDFNSNIDDTFNNYVVTGTHTLSGSQLVYCRLKTGDPVTIIDNNYRSIFTGPGGSIISASNVSQASISQYTGSFITYFMNLRSSDAFKSIVSQGTGYVSASLSMYLREYTNALIDTSIINGIQIFLSGTGTFNTGKFTLYGIKEL